MIFMTIIWILVPFCVSAIYNYFYNKHINKEMNQPKKKAWVTPISVFFITLSLEFLVFLILAGLLSVKHNKTHEETSMHISNYTMYNEAEVNESIYSVFDGNEVNGYIRNVGSYKNFNYILYTCQYTLNTYPSHVLITDYVGNKDYLKEETTAIIQFINEDCNYGETQLDGIEQISDRVYHIIDLGNFHSININMYLYDKCISYILDGDGKTLEEYSAMDHLEDLQKNAIEEFTFTIKEISQ